MAGTLHSPNGICSHSKNPMFPTVKAVYCFEASSIVIYKNPDFKSKQEKYPAPTRSFLVLKFNLQKSKQKCRPPSFLHTSTIALHCGLWLGQIMATSSISFTWECGGILWNLSLKGSSSVTLISCLARSMQSNSSGSREKMSWYSASRTYEADQFLADHPSRPDKSSCCKSTSFLCPTNILACQIPCILLSFSNVPGKIPTCGMAFTATT